MKNSQVSADAARLINSKVDDEELAEKLMRKRKSSGLKFQEKDLPRRLSNYFKRDNVSKRLCGITGSPRILIL